MSCTLAAVEGVCQEKQLLRAQRGWLSAPQGLR